ncbi:MAG: YihY family inner membrane protein [Candidatus Omnitrophica bacterium]|nr:YihY family inner membrane protein [Candidatus Omnitrophota bacterium]
MNENHVPIPSLAPPEEPVEPKQSRMEAFKLWCQKQIQSSIIIKFGYGLRIAWKIFNEKGVLAHASVCGYSMILSLVPVLAISLSILTAFTSSEVVAEGDNPVQQEKFSNRVFDFLFEHFVPGLSDEALVAKQELMEFVQKTASLRFVILVLLIIASVSLYNSIEHAFNEIWSVRNRRSLFAQFLAFWIIVTLTPLLLGLSYYYTTEFASSETVSHFMSKKWGFWLFWHTVSYIFTLFAFLIANRYLPNVHVNMVPALVGSALSAILWEAAKVMFDVYISYALTKEGYYTIYGTLAAIPLFILWLYYSFLCFLLGPVIATTIQNYDRHLAHLRRKPRGFTHRPIHALHVFLDIIRHFRDQKRGISLAELEMQSGVANHYLRRCLRALEQARLIHQDRQQQYYYPSLDPDQVMVGEVLERLIGLGPVYDPARNRPPDPLEENIRRLLKQSGGLPIGSFLKINPERPVLGEARPAESEAAMKAY